MNQSGPFVLGNSVFREIQIVNGNVVRDVELVREADSKKEIIEGHINNVPVEFVREIKKSHKKTNKKKSAKVAKKKSLKGKDKRATKSTKK